MAFIFTLSLSLAKFLSPTGETSASIECLIDRGHLLAAQDVYSVKVPVPAGGSVEVLAYTAAVGTQRPLPADILQGESQ